MRSGDGLDVSGGRGARSSQTHDMRGVATTLDLSGDAARGIGRNVMRQASGLPEKSALLAPGTAFRVASQVTALTAGPHGLASLGIRVEIVARGVRFAAGAYDLVEVVARGYVEAAQCVTAVPRLSVLLIGGVLVATAATQIPQLPGHTDDEARAAMARYAGVEPGHGGFAQIFLGYVNRQVYADPDLVNVAIGGVRLITLGPLIPLEVQTAHLLGTAQALGLATDNGPISVTAVPPDGPGEVLLTTDPPTDLGDLMQSQRLIESSAAGGAAHSRVRVQRVLADDGSHRWIVNIPGTQDWSPHEPANPSDAGANAALMAETNPRLLGAITTALDRAMEQAGVPPGAEPVMLSGHSQGGLAAANLAADNGFRERYAVTHVVTAGSPISRIDIPPGVKVLTLEHTTDPVPRLDQADEPATFDRVRVRTDAVLPHDMTRPGEGPGAASHERAVDTPIDTHSASRYEETARTKLGRDADQREVRDFYSGAAPFLTGHGTTYDYYLTRDKPQTPRQGR